MKLGRVIGTLVATVKPDAMKGLKLLIVRPLTAELQDDGEPFVATDASAQASSGDLVTWEASREAALLHDPWFIPVDHAVVGIVDQHALESPESSERSSVPSSTPSTPGKSSSSWERSYRMGRSMEPDTSSRSTWSEPAWARPSSWRTRETPRARSSRTRKRR
jgi:ethanolamine utilization protein EutN